MSCWTIYVFLICCRIQKHAFDYIQNNGGIDTEKSYPYEAIDYGHCKYSKKNAGATIKGYVEVDIEHQNENKLKAAIATIGPISISIYAEESFKFYSGGVYYEPHCIDNIVNHAILAVGYGTNERGEEYYIVKNSWGKHWGENGYIKMARNRDNNCGIASSARYPLV